MERPLVVVEAGRDVFDAAVASAVNEGRRVEMRLDAIVADGVVCTGDVIDAASASLAVLAAVKGAGVIVHATADRETIDRLCDDLRRLGTVRHLTGAEPKPPSLTDEERSLLALLSEGVSLGDAAKRLHLARRTADRRLARVRENLGVRTTAEALVRAKELGAI